MNFNSNNTQDQRECNRCKVVKALTTNNYHADKSRSGGFMYNCRLCETNRSREKYLKNPRKNRWSEKTPEQKAHHVKLSREYFRTAKGRSIGLLQGYRGYDRKKGLHTDIDQDYLREEILSKPCSYCGCIDQPIGADRIDNTLGHLKTNLIPACGLCNITRSNNFTVEEMKELGKMIAEFRKIRNINVSFYDKTDEEGMTKAAYLSNKLLIKELTVLPIH